MSRSVTENVTKKARGRPRSVAPLTAAERARRHRAVAKAKAKPIRSAEELFEDLCAQRGIVSGFDKVLAQECVNELIEGDLQTAIKALGLLPVPRAVEAGSPRVSTSDARARVLQMILNAVSAGKIERRRAAEAGEALSPRDALQLQIDMLDEPPALPDAETRAVGEGGVARTELQAALARIESLQDEILHLRGKKPRRLPPPHRQPMKAVKVSGRDVPEPDDDVPELVDVAEPVPSAAPALAQRR
jgi:hypothetical protein